MTQKKMGRPPVEKVTVACEGCGGLLSRYKWQVEKVKTGRFFCSPECRNKVGSKPRRGEERPCEHEGCDETFYVRQSSTKRFHSRECRELAARESWPEYLCEGCGKTFVVRRGQTQFNANKYCSRGCYKKSRYEQSIGRKKHTSDGYITVKMPDHPDAQAAGWILEHRLVMEEMIGRRLLPEETPHHKNGKRDDNEPRNLELWVSSQPSGQRVEDIVEWSLMMIERYAPENLAIHQ